MISFSLHKVSKFQASQSKLVNTIHDRGWRRLFRVCLRTQPTIPKLSYLSIACIFFSPIGVLCNTSRLCKRSQIWKVKKIRTWWISNQINWRKKATTSSRSWYFFVSVNSKKFQITTFSVSTGTVFFSNLVYKSDQGVMLLHAS